MNRNQQPKCFNALFKSDSLTGILKNEAIAGVLDSLTGILLNNVLTHPINHQTTNNSIRLNFRDYFHLQLFLFASSFIKDQFGAGLQNSILLSPTLPENVRALITNFVVVGTPYSDSEVLAGTSHPDIIAGREGNDVILGVNPGSAHPGRGDFDFFVGDVGKDRFILGDWRNVYYVGKGTKDLASIVDFNPNEDKIQLHGNQSDYVLVNFSELQLSGEGTAIFKKGSRPDIIALIPGISNLNLTGNYFQFVGNAPPPESNFKEVKQFGTVGLDYSFGVSTDNSGNVFLTGATDGNLGGLNAGDRDAWVAKYDGNGNQQWVRQFGTSARDESFGIASDRSGNIFVTGTTFGSLGKANAGIERDVWIAKYDTNGNQKWIQQFGTFGFDNSYKIATDDSGNVYVTTYTRGNLFGDQNQGQNDVWVTKYDTNGNQQWSQQFGTPGFELSFGVTTDHSGNVFATGWIQDNSGRLTADSYDAWITKYDTNGNQQWSKEFGTSVFDWSWDVATDQSGNVYATGLTSGDLGGTNAGSYDAWIAKYDTNGNQKWTKQLGTAGDDNALAIATDMFGNIYLTGATDGNLGGVNAGSDDAWVAKYDANGNQQWITQFGTSNLDKGYDIAVDNLGHVFVTGVTEASLGAKNIGSFDSWVGKLSSTDGGLLSFNPPVVDQQAWL
ncbi:SBBP repeat-containing protein [Desmonostoc muscorum LEGE 12446]|uniref:SBBP repeat-containing protein n=1 Tax=Desmonostoc muscorum LEGE 12446 TaxID=1828758 RepID=A0A8J6ZQU1_DESMC|nr:SBBP repeat-containing protein [Desmonostoc muscorum]MCF2144941.1 SBBP repeat-containing protein [Desmonostoc muscorum LEGE 12446]